MAPEVIAAGQRGYGPPVGYSVYTISIVVVVVVVIVIIVVVVVRLIFGR